MTGTTWMREELLMELWYGKLCFNILWPSSSLMMEVIRRLEVNAHRIDLKRSCFCSHQQEKVIVKAIVFFDGVAQCPGNSRIWIRQLLEPHVGGRIRGNGKF